MDEPGETDDLKELQAELDGLSRTLERKITNQAGKISEYAKKDPRCLPVSVEAIPDPIFDLLSPSVRRECSEVNVEVIPYSLLLPFLGSTRRLNQYGKSDIDRVLDSLVKVRGHLNDIESVLTNNVERAHKLLGSAVQEMRDKIGRVQAELSSAQPLAGPSDKDVNHQVRES
jgi:hypothetical protein